MFNCRYHYNADDAQKSVPLGDAVLKLKDADISSIPVVFTLKFVNPNDGKHKGEVIDRCYCYYYCLFSTFMRFIVE
jgi:hypothetical protein